MDSEFELISRYFVQPAPHGYLGPGDDCALAPVPPGQHLAVSTDTLLQGRHFFADVDPVSLGHKALAVNISDLAAMGAQPLGCLLSLAMPVVDHGWLSAFSQGFHALAKQTVCPLIGGDTTRSETGIIINVTVLGQVSAANALRRDAAQTGDDIWVTGCLGAPDIALRLLTGQLPADNALLAATRAALEKPLPPWRFGPALCGVAHAALDISDGLVQDLGHILKASNCGADLYYPALPADPALCTQPEAILRDAVLAGGDVYQLCFTAAQKQRAHIHNLANSMDVKVSRVGRIVAEPGLRIYAENGSLMNMSHAGFDHFSDSQSG